MLRCSWRGAWQRTLWSGVQGVAAGTNYQHASQAARSCLWWYLTPSCLWWCLQEEGADLGDAAKSVAVKQLKRDATDDSPAAVEFFKEMQLMMKLGRHSNVISLIGVCRTERPLLMLVELADMGELLGYIRARRPDPTRNIGAQLGADDFVTFAAQVASGMEFLYQNRVGLNMAAAR